jgi:uncharacterized protein
MMRSLPKVYDWTIRQRIRRLYAELRHVDDRLKIGMDDIGRITSDLEHLEDQANALKVPVAYANQLYDLRQHIGVVRSSLNRHIAEASTWSASPDGAKAKSGTTTVAAE